VFRGQSRTPGPFDLAPCFASRMNPCPSRRSVQISSCLANRATRSNGVQVSWRGASTPVVHSLAWDCRQHRATCHPRCSPASRIHVRSPNAT
jgi:hypothetical protein